MKRARLIGVEARRAAEEYIVKKENMKNKGSIKAFQRFKCSYVGSALQTDVKCLEEKMGSLQTDVNGLCTEVSFMCRSASACLTSLDKLASPKAMQNFLVQEPLLKKKMGALQEEVKGLRADVSASLCDNMASLKSICADLQAEVAIANGNGRDWRERMDAELTEWKDKVGCDVERMRRLQEEMRGLRDEVAKMDSDAVGALAKVNSDVANVAGVLAKVDSDSDVAGTGQQLDKQISRMQEDLTGLRVEVAMVDSNVVGMDLQLHKQISRMQEDLTGLMAEVAKLGCDLNDKARPDSHGDAAVESSSVAVYEVLLHQRMIALENRLKGLEYALGRLRTDVGVGIKSDRDYLLETYSKDVREEILKTTETLSTQICEVHSKITSLEEKLGRMDDSRIKEVDILQVLANNLATTCRYNMGSDSTAEQTHMDTPKGDERMMRCGLRGGPCLDAALIPATSHMGQGLESSINIFMEELQGLCDYMAMMREKDRSHRDDMDKIQMDLLRKMREETKTLCADVAALKQNATKGQRIAGQDVFRSYDEMGTLVDIARTREVVDKLWCKWNETEEVINESILATLYSQQGDIMLTRKMVESLSSDVKNTSVGKKHSNVLVKISSVFLACTVVIYAWSSTLG